MEERTTRKRGGCGQTLAVAAMLAWLVIAPTGARMVGNRVLRGVVAPGMASAAAIAIGCLALVLPYVGVALLARGRGGREAIGVAATALFIAAGYLVLDAMVRALFPENTAPISSVPPLEGLLTVPVRLAVLVPYTLLAIWVASRLIDTHQRSLGAWLGLRQFELPPFLLALMVAALVTFPWPLTGALGDSLTSLRLAFQTLGRIIPEVLIFWGVVFLLLTSTFERTWAAALVTILLYAMSAFGGSFLVDAHGVGIKGLLLLPLAFLLTEMRARGSSLYALLPLAFCYWVIPRLFLDPRDAIAQGIPELQHVASYLVVAVTAAVLGLLLWIGRRWLSSRRERDARSVARVVGLGLAVMVAWGAWVGLYVFAGVPGFSNDGFLIILEEQADLSAAVDVAGREARLARVYAELTRTAESTQADLRAELDRRGVPYRPYYIVNMIRVDGHRWLMGRFEDRPGVAQVILNPNVREYPRRIQMPYGEGTDPGEGVQENLTAIHANDAWAEGITGQGVVVGGQDTGYDWDHPALKPHYRGWDGQSADHDYNWHDAWDDTAVPFDDGSHGTHTMGIVLGDDGGGNRTGVAPDARWIGCRNMQRGFGNPGSYAECMEFFLAPYPHGGDPFAGGDVRQAPHVINNSWGCPDFEGCFPETLKPAVEALRAAGIMMVVSAGNDGPACGTATTPPANYDAVFSVGATSNGGRVVGFSSRGPVDGLIKPDVAAPGERVRSSVPDGGYGYAGGTSMAGPHVAGVAALLWSADPTLVGDVDATEALICRTATSRPVENLCTVQDEVPEGPFASVFAGPPCACGGVTGAPNNVYGCGLVDAGAAVQSALEH